MLLFFTLENWHYVSESVHEVVHVLELFKLFAYFGWVSVSGYEALICASYMEII